MERATVFTDWKSHMENICFPRVINRFKAVPTKTPARFYVYIDKAASFYMEQLQF